MNYNFRNNPDFKDILKQKERDIIKRTSEGIQETETFKQLHLSLVSYLKASAKLDFKVLLISKQDFENLSDDCYDKLVNILDSDDCVLNNYVVLNAELNIVNKTRDGKYQNSNDARKIYAELSHEYIVFLLQPHAMINYFIDGEDFGEGIFFTMDAYKSYEERKTIDYINELFDDYRQYLRNRNNYNKFFISKAHLLSLKDDLKSTLEEKEFIKEHKHLLENKPEDKFRDDLRMFLSNKLKASFLSKEYILENFNRLDIYMLDESGNELYLIEVKWVGTSIHRQGKKIGTSFEEKDITPDAVKQSVSYLKQLHNEQKNIKLGYLAVFDARKNDLPDTGKNISETIFGDEDKMHYRKFRKIPDFRVINEHPS